MRWCPSCAACAATRISPAIVPASFTGSTDEIFAVRFIRPGWFYALQRLFAETMIALEVLDRRFDRARGVAMATPTSREHPDGSLDATPADQSGSNYVDPKALGQERQSAALPQP